MLIRSRVVVLLCVVLLGLGSASLYAEEQSANDGTPSKELYNSPKQWGLAMGLRYAKIPYNTDEGDRVGDIMPLFFYEHKYFFLYGLTAGFNVPLNEKWEVALLGRYRFFDIPEEFQNQVRGHAFDYGGRLRYNFRENLYSDLEILTDNRNLWHSNLLLSYEWESSRWWIKPWGRLRYKTSDFNNTYYGLNIVEPGSGFDATVGVDARMHLWSNLKLVGRFAYTRFDKETSETPVMRGNNHVETFIGVGVFNDEKKRFKLQSRPYLRLSYGWGTPSDLAQIIRFNAEKDPKESRMTSVFYGHPVSDRLGRLPIPVYLTGGLVIHHKNDYQPRIEEMVLAFKFFYTIPLPVRFRLGFAEGLSFANQVPAMEQGEMDKKGYRSSRLLNYLDFSLGVNLGDIFRVKTIDDLWLGYAIHHRSGIFTSSSAFGRISGGSNFQTVYLQYHF